MWGGKWGGGLRHAGGLVLRLRGVTTFFRFPQPRLSPVFSSRIKHGVTIPAVGPGLFSADIKLRSSIDGYAHGVRGVVGVHGVLFARRWFGSRFKSGIIYFRQMLFPFRSQALVHSLYPTFPTEAA